MSAAVIIPAHNEASVIERSLTSLRSGLDPSVAVVVVCNGCADSTAEIARGVSDDVAVLETDVASKTAALNLGTELVASGPRLFLDADVTLDGEAASLLLDAVVTGAALVAEPNASFDTGESSLAVRWFYDVWVGLHGQAPGDVGGGAIALSVEAQGRVGKLPDVIADDAYIRSHFAASDIALVGAVTVVRTPRTARDLVRIKARSRVGNLELRSRYPDLWSGKRTSGRSLGTKARRLPVRLWLRLPAYVAIQSMARLRARRMMRSGSLTWERDHGSRS
jgi:glycosyltransferase involved in cell wall biosynthesis